MSCVTAANFFPLLFLFCFLEGGVLGGVGWGKIYLSSTGSVAVVEVLRLLEGLALDLLLKLPALSRFTGVKNQEDEHLLEPTAAGRL